MASIRFDGRRRSGDPVTVHPFIEAKEEARDQHHVKQAWDCSRFPSRLLRPPNRRPRSLCGADADSVRERHRFTGSSRPLRRLAPAAGGSPHDRDTCPRVRHHADSPPTEADRSARSTSGPLRTIGARSGGAGPQAPADEAARPSAGGPLVRSVRRCGAGGPLPPGLVRAQGRCRRDRCRARRDVERPGTGLPVAGRWCAGVPAVSPGGSWSAGPSC